MAGPVYLQGDNKHNFDVIQKHLDTLKEVHGPVYITENAKHSFSEVQKAAEQIRNLNHPVLNTGEAKNHFNQMINSAETLKNMNGRRLREHIFLRQTECTFSLSYPFRPCLLDWRVRAQIFRVHQIGGCSQRTLW